MYFFHSLVLQIHLLLAVIWFVAQILYFFILEKRFLQLLHMKIMESRNASNR